MFVPRVAVAAKLFGNMILPTLKSNIENIKNVHYSAPIGQISEIYKLANWLVEQYQNGDTPNLNFICTHNSRRSQIGQFWGAVLPHLLQLPMVNSFSGGTEVTACHPNTLKALATFGVKISTLSEGENPHYQLHFGSDIPDLESWSKLYSDIANPKQNFVAVMTCNTAIENCPHLEGATLRIFLPFTDPKYADDTLGEAEAYQQTIEEMGQVMLAVFQQVKILLAN